MEELEGKNDKTENVEGQRYEPKFEILFSFQFFFFSSYNMIIFSIYFNVSIVVFLWMFKRLYSPDVQWRRYYASNQSLKVIMD